MKKRLVAGILAAAVLAGCAKESGYVKDGVAYGVTDGVFRGRWWSYYERGTSFVASPAGPVSSAPATTAASEPASATLVSVCGPWNDPRPMATPITRAAATAAHHG